MLNGEDCGVECYQLFENLYMLIAEIPSNISNSKNSLNFIHIREKWAKCILVSSV
jgi:hypothetical protein